MVGKELPFDKALIEKVMQRFSTPFHIYYEKGIRQGIRKLLDAFSYFDFKEYFAVKACPNPYIMEICKEEGLGMDCSSIPELVLSDNVGIIGENIMFSSNNTEDPDFTLAKKLGAIINLDDITHIPLLEESVGIPELICCRYNPGPLKEGNVIIGNPEEAKYGMTRPQILEAYKILKEKGVKRFGLHTMVISNELDPDYFIDTARMLFDLTAEIKEKLGIKLEFVNLGGGIGIPYKPEDNEVDVYYVADGVKKFYDDIIVKCGLDPLKIYLECGRLVTGPYGHLVMKVNHIEKKYRNYVGVNGCMADLMRPAMYGAYHHITILGKENAPNDFLCDVKGSLCENIDKFAVQRYIPKPEIGDLLVVHDTGAHGRAMGFNYNAKLRSGELLIKENGDIVQIRRPETIEDYFATLDFSQLKNQKKK